MAVQAVCRREIEADGPAAAAGLDDRVHAPAAAGDQRRQELGHRSAIAPCLAEHGHGAVEADLVATASRAADRVHQSREFRRADF